MRYGPLHARFPPNQPLAMESDTVAPAAGGGGPVETPEGGAPEIVAEDGATVRSPWRVPAAVAKGKRDDGPVMGPESWPALTDARAKGGSNPACTRPALPAVPPPAAATAPAAGNVGPVPRNGPPPPPPLPFQVSFQLLILRVVEWISGLVS